MLTSEQLRILGQVFTFSELQQFEWSLWERVLTAGVDYETPVSTLMKKVQDILLELGGNAEDYADHTVAHAQELLSRRS